MAQRTRIVSYDALRVFAIVSVVAIHTLMPYRDLLPDTAPVRVFDDLLHYAVPLFVFISGVFSWSKPLPAEKGSYARFLVRRGSVVFVPYLAWSAVFLVVLLATASRTPGIGRVIGLLLSGHTWYHLYFIPMLLTFYALTPLANRLSRISPEVLLLTVYALRIGTNDPAVWSALRTTLGPLGSAYATHLITHLPHMALGGWFAMRYDVFPAWVRRSWPVLLVAGTAVIFSASMGWTAGLPLLVRRFVYPLGMAATVVGLALAARSLEPWLHARPALARRLLDAASLAFGVYFVHPLWLLGVDALVTRFAEKTVWLEPWFPVAVFAAVTGLSFGVAYALARTPLVCRLAGIDRPISGV